MLIAPGVHQFNASFVNVFVVESPDGLMLVDSGQPGDTDKLLKQMREAGLDPSSIRLIFLTHGDGDHIGGAARFQALSGARVLAHPADVAHVEGREQRLPAASGLGLLLRPLFGVMSRTVMKVKPVKVDQQVKEGDTVADGWQVIHLPGHTAGQVGLYHPERRVALAADAINHRRGLGAPPPVFTPDMPAAYASIRKLAGLDINVLGMGHGDALTQDTSGQLRAFAATLPRGTAA